MKSLPRTSIVVPVLDHAEYLHQTLESLIQQDYPCLDVIIQSNRLVAGAEEAVRSHPGIFRLCVETHGGFADALNRGFARGAGEVRGALLPGEFLLPRALHSVATRIDPDAGRHVVMGKSVFVLEDMGDVAVPHPSEYLGHFDHLAVWNHRFNRVPRSSVFWHHSVAERVGDFNVGPPHVVDYEFICRVGASYPIHVIDDLWSACMIPQAEVAGPGESEMLDAWIDASRAHWGSWLSPLRWRCEASQWRYSRHLHEHARHYARQRERAVAEGRPLAAAAALVKTWFCSPAMARGRFGSGR